MDPSVGRTDATVVLHWANKRSTEEFYPEITVVLIVAEKKIPEDNLLSNQKKATLKSKAKKSSYGAQDCTNRVACLEFLIENLAEQKSHFQKTESN